MAGIEHDRDQTVDHRFTRFFAGVNFRRFRQLLGLFQRRIFRLFLADLEILFEARRLDRILAPFKQRHQRVGRIDRIDVENQPVAVFAGRLEFENLRCDLGLELHDQAHDAGLETPGTQQLDVGIVGRDLARQTVEHAVEFDTFDIDDQTVRILDGELRVFERRVAFERDARVIGCRPDAHGEHRGRLDGGPGQW